MTTQHRIALVEDDAAILDSLQLYLSAKKLDVHCFGDGANALTALNDGLVVDCIVSDVRMPGLSGLELQRELAARGNSTPLILITGHGDIEMAVTALKAGASDFLEKPFDEERLLVAIKDAMARKANENGDEWSLESAARSVVELSERQRAVMDLAVQGFTNKEIATRLGISPRTVETHRAWVMERTGAKNLAHLVRIAMVLESKN